MTMRPILYVFRHGQTDWNKEGRIQGHLDVPLNEEGRLQARRLLPVLKRLEVQSFLSSDLSRARETAEIPAFQLGLPVAVSEGLREIFLGGAQGLTRQEIEAKYGTEFSDRMRTRPLGDEDVVRLGSESGDAVVERALRSIEAHLQASPVSKLAICSHGGVVRRLVQRALPTGEFPPPIVNGVVYPFEFHREEGRLFLMDRLIWVGEGS
jgi:probable phosphoglycerate mutase